MYQKRADKHDVRETGLYTCLYRRFDYGYQKPVYRLFLIQKNPINTPCGRPIDDRQVTARTPSGERRPVRLAAPERANKSAGRRSESVT